MKFDVVIGNPPYQDSSQKAKNNKLWHKFVDKSLSMLTPGGTLSLLTPSTIVGQTGYSLKMTNLLSSKYNCTLIDYTVNHQFNVGVDICRCTVINEEYQGNTHIVMDDDTFDHDLSTGVPLSSEDIIKQSIIDKITYSHHPRIKMVMGQSISSDQYVEDGEYEVYASGQQIRTTNVVPDTGNELKFVIPFSSSYKNRFTTHGYIGMLNMWCHLDSESEGHRLSSILDIPLIQFYIENYKRTSGFTPAVKNSMIPDIINSSLISQFNLTTDEVHYLQTRGVTVEEYITEASKVS